MKNEGKIRKTKITAKKMRERDGDTKERKNRTDKRKKQRKRELEREK